MLLYSSQLQFLFFIVFISEEKDALKIRQIVKFSFNNKFKKYAYHVIMIIDPMSGIVVALETGRRESPGSNPRSRLST